MAQITKKGIPAYTSKEEIPNSLFTWLQKLQLLFPKVSTYSQTISPTIVNATSESDQTFTVTGLDTTDIVYVNPSALDAGIGIMWARVSATNTLQVRLRNFTGGNITPTSGTWKIVAIRL